MINIFSRNVNNITNCIIQSIKYKVKKGGGYAPFPIKINKFNIGLLPKAVDILIK